MKKISIDEVVDLAFMFDEYSPIDWGKLREGKEPAMRMIAASIIEQFDVEEITDDHILVMISAITKLTTENMLLYTELMQKEK